MMDELAKHEKENALSAVEKEKVLLTAEKQKDSPTPEKVSILTSEPESKNSTPEKWFTPPEKKGTPDKWFTPPEHGFTPPKHAVTPEKQSKTLSNALSSGAYDYNSPSIDGCHRVKIICLGDSAVGKSKLVERFLLDGFKPHQLSTYALTMYQHKMEIDNDTVTVDIWDTAGQERFNNLHPSYYHQAHACIMVFDITRKVTYKNLANWSRELREFRPEIPCLCAANKIDVDYEIAKKGFALPKRHGMPLYFVSASDGTNVVKLFKDAVTQALQYKKCPTDFTDTVYQELEAFKIQDEEDESS